MTSLANAFAIGYGQTVRSWLEKQGEYQPSPGLRSPRFFGIVPHLTNVAGGAVGATAGYLGGKALSTSALGRVPWLSRLTAGGGKSRLAKGLLVGGGAVGAVIPLIRRLRQQHRYTRARMAGRGGGR